MTIRNDNSAETRRAADPPRVYRDDGHGRRGPHDRPAQGAGRSGLHGAERHAEHRLRRRRRQRARPTSGPRAPRTSSPCAIVDDTQMAGFLTNKENKPEFQPKYDKANKYRDFRQMLDKEKSLDAITVSTPDHTHAVIAMTAMKMGKHVFVQKPLTHTIKEARLLAEEAKKRNLVTQMGNQGHSKEGARLICEWIWDGAIGDVREAHVWTNRPIWPQGIDAPKEIPSVPPTLDWDVWLGPAPWRPYHPAYLPFNWRGWWDFGTGAVGDMGAHLIDQIYLGAQARPRRRRSRPARRNTPRIPIPSPKSSLMSFPARGNMPPAKMVWYDGGLMPPRPAGLDRRPDDGRRRRRLPVRRQTRA